MKPWDTVNNSYSLTHLSREFVNDIDVDSGKLQCISCNDSSWKISDALLLAQKYQINVLKCGSCRSK
jgi:hypothetical protein